MSPAGPCAELQRLATLLPARSALMSDDEQRSETYAPSRLAAHEDARALVRLVQCPLCSRPFRTPVTLPCGNTLCRDCLPEAHERENISYPDLPGRKQAFQCPFPECAEEHPVSDCNIDVTLSKVMEAIQEIVAKHTSVAGDMRTAMQKAEKGVEENASLLATSDKSHQHELPGGRLVATYVLAAQGELDYETELIYRSEMEDEESRHAVDVNLLTELMESAQREVDCQVCYHLMLDPVTTFCGHTLCRDCLARVLDHSFHCPVCRRSVNMPPSLNAQPSNRTLVNLLNGLCPETLAARAEALSIEERGGEGETLVPLFVCTLGFPNQPTFLRIFEPRYRLMLRRCIEGDGEFGILMYNRYFEPQGDLGPVHFFHYGTMLQIVHSQVMADGTSLVETRGAYRFRVKAHGVLDGYSVGSVERVEDVPLAEEERIEAEETSADPIEGGGFADEINRMSTQALLALCQEFISKMQNRSAAWLQQRMLDVHGQPPDDAALFPYWFASVLPFSDEEKYKLLGTTTVRERIKITATWVRRIEAQRWVD